MQLAQQLSLRCVAQAIEVPCLSVLQHSPHRSLECYASFAVLPYAYLQLGESDKASNATQHAHSLCRQIVDRKTRAQTCMAVTRALQMVSLPDAETCSREAGLTLWHRLLGDVLSFLSPAAAKILKAVMAFRALDDPVGEAAAQSLLAQAVSLESPETCSESDSGGSEVLVMQDACQEAVRRGSNERAYPQMYMQTLCVCAHIMAGLREMLCVYLLRMACVLLRHKRLMYPGCHTTACLVLARIDTASGDGHVPANLNSFPISMRLLLFSDAVGRSKHGKLLRTPWLKFGALAAQNLSACLFSKALPRLSPHSALWHSLNKTAWASLA